MLSSTTSPYPATPLGRDRWVLSHRGARNDVSTTRPYAFLLEQEPSAGGDTVDTVTIFLTGRECPWRCLMCDLWQNTTTGRTPVGALPAQIEFALREIRIRGRKLASDSGPEDGAPRGHRTPLPGRIASQIKLYNSGSFFDRAAVPVEDYPAIAGRVAGFDRVIVECHPKLIGDLTWTFRDLLESTAMQWTNELRQGSERGKTGALRDAVAPSHTPILEVAMGLETAHPDVLQQLNKRFDLDDFARAAGQLRRERVDLRVFVLVKPPFMNEEEGVDWAVRSAGFAFDLGATVVSLIPTRPGNGALEALARQGCFAPPTLDSLESAFDQCLALGRGRVLADTWDLGRFSSCAACFGRRQGRIVEMNLGQRILPPVPCSCRPH